MSRDPAIKRKSSTVSGYTSTASEVYFANLMAMSAFSRPAWILSHSSFRRILIGGGLRSLGTEDSSSEVEEKRSSASYLEDVDGVATLLRLEKDFFFPGGGLGGRSGYSLVMTTSWFSSGAFWVEAAAGWYAFLKERR